MEKLKEIELYIKQSRDELEGGVWDGDALSIFYMLEELQAENKRLKEERAKLLKLVSDIGFSPLPNKEQAEKIKWLKEGLISIRKSTEIMEARRFADQALKDTNDKEES